MTTLLFAVVDCMLEAKMLHLMGAAFATRTPRAIGARERAKRNLGAWRSLWPLEAP